MIEPRQVARPEASPYNCYCKNYDTKHPLVDTGFPADMMGGILYQCLRCWKLNGRAFGLLDMGKADERADALEDNVRLAKQAEKDTKRIAKLEEQLKQERRTVQERDAELEQNAGTIKTMRTRLEERAELDKAALSL